MNMYIHINKYITTINNKKFHDFEKKAMSGVWEDLEEGKGRNKGVIVL